MRIEYHRTLIADKARIAAFHAALRAAIRPGESVVSDIGAGTGLLGVLAARLGAKQVFLYEAGEVGAVAARVLKRNRVKNAELFLCHSTEFEDPPRADIVVSETLGNYAPEEDIVETMADAARRHLRRGGLLIPQRIVQFAAPVVADRIDRELRAWDRATDGLAFVDLSPARDMSLNNIYVRGIAPGDLLGPKSAIEWDRIELGSDARSSRKGEASWPIARSAAIHGFAAWWTARLHGEAALSTAPGARATHWEQLYLPLHEPMRMKRGERLMLWIRSRTTREAGTTIAWTATRRAADGAIIARQRMDLKMGYLP